MVVIVLSGIVMTTLYTAFQSSFISYLGLQKDASSLTELSYQSQRIAKVVRGATNLDTVAANEMVFYAYFAPTDAYVSKVRYYLSADSKKLYVDIIPMTANPPIGELITADKRSYTLIENFRQSPGQTLFNYLNSQGQPLTLPVSDLNAIKGIRINLATEHGYQDANQVNSVQVSLRNRKTNL